MHLDLSNLREVAATLRVEGDVCDVPSRSATPLDSDVAPQIQKLVATPIAEMEWVIAELQQAKAYLQSECERLEQRTTSASLSWLQKRPQSSLIRYRNGIPRAVIKDHKRTPSLQPFNRTET